MPEALALRNREIVAGPIRRAVSCVIHSISARAVAIPSSRGFAKPSVLLAAELAIALAMTIGCGPAPSTANHRANGPARAVTQAPEPAAKEPSIRQRVANVAAYAKRQLAEIIVPFWYPASIDRTHGGFVLGDDSADKTAVSQARMVWFFARLSRSELAGEPADDYFAAAAQGFDFFHVHLIDAEHGGAVWAVNADGSEVREAAKDLYAQAFALFAVSEFARAAEKIGDARAPIARQLAHEIFATIDAHMHDATHGGFREVFARDWAAVDAETRGFIGRQSPAEKTMNAHLHVMEAVADYLRLLPDDAAHRDLVAVRLRELVQILAVRVARRNGSTTDRHFADWSPAEPPENWRTSYGHDLENSWLLRDAIDTLAIAGFPLPAAPREAVERAAARMAENAWHFGGDSRSGGIFASGGNGEMADAREKIWWVQAEALLAAVDAFCRDAGDTNFSRIANVQAWIHHTQTDWRRGGWHAVIHEAGEIRGAKAGPWKTAYHNGRAMIETAERLQDWLARSPAGD